MLEIFLHVYFFVVVAVTKTMCKVFSIKESQMVDLTCYFPEDINKTKEDFVVYHYKDEDRKGIFTQQSPSVCLVFPPVYSKHINGTALTTARDPKTCFSITIVNSECLTTKISCYMRLEFRT